MNRTSLTRPVVTNVVLAVVLAALVGCLVLLALRETPAERQADEYSDITRAAREQTLAFLSIDHTRMDEVTDRVLEGSTGPFKEQYEASLESLKQSAATQESFSEGSVTEVGLSEVDTDSASVFVAAASEVRNKGTKGEPEDRSWRIKLTMAKEDGRWLVSQLEFVG